MSNSSTESTSGGSTTSTYQDRLAELGIELPPVAAAVGAYVPAVKSGDLVFTSGQLPFIDGALPRTGLVGVPSDHPGAEVSPEDAYDLAKTATLNAVAAIAEVIDLENIEQIVKVNGFVASANGFGGQPGVVNGASDVLGEIFGDAGVHARAAVGVAELPMGSPVEIELIVRARQ